MAKRVLVCDDAEDLRVLLTKALPAFGDFEVVGQAGNGREAVEAAGRLQPDVILLDLSMPLLDGLQALPEIRKVVPGARIIVMSGFDADSLADDARQAGADGYIVKGMLPKMMAREVERILRERDQAQR